MISTKKELKTEVIKNKQTHSNDTGSYQVQLAILDQDIKNLSSHLKVNRKDIVCRRLLLKKVAKHKKFTKKCKKINY